MYVFRVLFLILFSFSLCFALGSSSLLWSYHYFDVPDGVCKENGNSKLIAEFFFEGTVRRKINKWVLARLDVFICFSETSGCLRPVQLHQFLQQSREFWCTPLFVLCYLLHLVQLLEMFRESWAELSVSPVWNFEQFLPAKKTLHNLPHFGLDHE